MSTISQQQETEVWKIPLGYLINQTTPVSMDTCPQATSLQVTDNVFAIPQLTGMMCYAEMQTTFLATSSSFAESWATTTWAPNFETKDVTVSRLDLSGLAFAKELVRSFSADLQDIAEAILYNIEDDPDRPNGFIIEILAVIPESNRESEYRIYGSLGKLMRNNPKVLIDLHIVKRRGRQIKQLIPPEYQEL